MVSIIIPVWGDYKKYLPDCIASIERQTYKDYEVIIVENKTDLPSARNEGIKRAKGEYILPLDVDDCLREDYLEKTVGKGDIITTAYYNNSEKKVLPAREINLADLKRTNLIIACSLFKKEVWEKVGGYDEEMKDGYEDWDFWIRCLTAGYKVITIDEPLYEYKKRRESMVNTMNRQKAEQYIKNKQYGRSL